MAKMKFNPFTSSFDYIGEGGGGAEVTAGGGLRIDENTGRVVLGGGGLVANSKAIGLDGTPMGTLITPGARTSNPLTIGTTTNWYDNRVRASFATDEVTIARYTAPPGGTAFSDAGIRISNSNSRGRLRMGTALDGNYASSVGHSGVDFDTSRVRTAWGDSRSKLWSSDPNVWTDHKQDGVESTKLHSSSEGNIRTTDLVGDRVVRNSLVKESGGGGLYKASTSLELLAPGAPIAVTGVDVPGNTEENYHSDKAEQSIGHRLYRNSLEGIRFDEEKKIEHTMDLTGSDPYQRLFVEGERLGLRATSRLSLESGVVGLETYTYTADDDINSEGMMLLSGDGFSVSSSHGWINISSSFASLYSPTEIRLLSAGGVTLGSDSTVNADPINIHMVADPVADTDAANKQYVDSAVANAGGGDSGDYVSVDVPTAQGTNSSRAYGYNASTEDVEQYFMNTMPQPNSLVLRDDTGHINSAGPFNGDHVANKTYVDNSIAASFPSAPPTGTHTLKAIGGQLQWVED